MSNYTNLILRTLTSLYGDITRGGVLSWNDVDQNFLYLKGNLIYSSTTLGNTIYLQKYNGETISFLGGSGGTSNDTYWTSGSTGNYSLKANNDSSLDALGDYSLAEGWNTTAIGISSHAEGVFTTAYGFVSHAEGSGTTAFGQFSHSSGYDTTAIGDQSHSEGKDTTSGWRGFTVYNYSGGTVNIIGYGDLTNSFYPNIGSGILFDNNAFKTPYSGTSWDGTYFKINLTNSPITYNALYVADIDNLYDYYANNLLGDNSHAEGTKTSSFGDASHAEGEETTSIGDSSHAEGQNTISIGVGSHAEGEETTSIGDSSHAEGQNTISIGVGSHAEGSTTHSFGYGSHSEGYYTTAIGDISHAEGSTTHSFGYGSHSEGYETTSNGIYSHTEGGYTISGWKGFTISSISGNVITISGYGNTLNTSFGNTGTLYDNYDNRTIYSSKTWDSIGYVLTISIVGTFPITPQFIAPLNNLYDSLADNFGGEHSHSEGYITSAIGSYSHSEGYITSAIGGESHAEGYQTIAFGQASHAEGTQSNASGYGSHAEGRETTSIGSFSHSEGYKTTAYGDYSFVHGTGSTASASTSIVLGNNITGTTSNTVYVSNLNIKTLGAGASVNNLGIDVSGNVVNGGTSSDSYVTDFTYNNNTFTIGRNNLSALTQTVNTMTGLTINGNLTVTGNLSFTGQSNNPIYSAGTITSTYIPNWNNSNIQTFTLTAATTNISGGTNTKNGAIYTIILKQDGSGSKTVNWGAPYKWQSAIPPVITSTPNAVDILTFISDGTNLYGLIAKDFR